MHEERSHDASVESKTKTEQLADELASYQERLVAGHLSERYAPDGEESTAHDPADLERLKELRQRNARRPAVRPEEAPGAEAGAKRSEKIEPIERELLELLIVHPECLPAVRSQIEVQEGVPDHLLV